MRSWKMVLPGSSLPFERGEEGCRAIVTLPFSSARVTAMVGLAPPAGAAALEAAAVGAPAAADPAGAAPALVAVVGAAAATVGVLTMTRAPPVLVAAGAVGALEP